MTIIIYCLIYNYMKRNSCPTCDCGFREDASLFANLTGTWTQMALQKIRNRKSFIEWLKENAIVLEKIWAEWIFPPWICKSVRVKILTKIQALDVDISWDNGDLSQLLTWNTWWEYQSIDWINPLSGWQGRDYRSED